MQNVEDVEYSSNYSETTGCLWFYSKHEAINFNGAIANDHKFKFLKDKANLSENSRPDGANAVTKNATNVVSLKYLSNF